MGAPPVAAQEGAEAHDARGVVAEEYVRCAEYLRCADGQPDIAQAARSGAAVTYRPAVCKGDVVVCDNRRVWHRTPPSLDEACADDDALMTVRLKHFPPR